MSGLIPAIYFAFLAAVCAILFTHSLALGAAAGAMAFALGLYNERRFKMRQRHQKAAVRQ